MRTIVRQTLLEILEVPRTYEEISEIMDVAYYTARRYVQELVDEGQVQQCLATAPNGKLLFQLRVNASTRKEILFPVGKEIWNLAEAVLAISKTRDLMTYSVRAVMFRVSHSRWSMILKGADIGDLRQHNLGAKYPHQVRTDLRNNVKELKAAVALLEMIVLKDEVWDETPGVVWERSGYSESAIEQIDASSQLYIRGEN